RTRSPHSTLHVPAVRGGRAVHRHQGPVREARGNDLVFRATGGRRVRSVSGAGVLHAGRHRRRGRDRAEAVELVMLKVSVISPEAVLFEGETDSVVAPAYDGEVGILTGHAPLMALLGDGELRLGGAGRRFKVSGGFMQV